MSKQVVQQYDQEEDGETREDQTEQWNLAGEIAWRLYVPPKSGAVVFCRTSTPCHERRVKIPFRQKGIANKIETIANAIPNSPANQAALPVSTVIASNNHWMTALWQAWSIAAGHTDPVFNRSHAASAPVAMIMTVKQRRATHFGAELL